VGLDMYLKADHYCPGGFEHVRESSIEQADAARFDAILSAFGTGYEEHRNRYPEGDSLVVSFKVAYWRKANAIHSWFVRNVQDGKDECQRSYVSREQLTELIDACRRILETVVQGDPETREDAFVGSYQVFPNLTMDLKLAREILPTESGFFFGNTEYDEWYVTNLESTVSQLEAAMNDSNNELASFYYQASW